MVSINRSFVYGICFASTTWLVSLCLYMSLMNNDLQTTTNRPYHPTKSYYNSNNLVDYTKKRYEKASYIHRKKTGYFSSKTLVKKLQLVSKEPGSEQDKVLTDLGLIRTEDDQRRKDEGYKRHAYNVLISNRLSYNRSIPDTRNELCKDVKYPEALPTASVIICFYNEHNNTLLRAVHSIMDRTPTTELKEIILVDDYSDLPDLHQEIATYVDRNFDGRVKLIKTKRREGLIRARLFGARRSQGDVIVFLDSHVEVNVGWAEPLLARIKDNRTNVVVPVIDIINADTFAYTNSPLVRGGFNWGLHFKWENLPKGALTNKEDFVKPIKSPTMAGGLFAMDKGYFTELGEYDAGMNIWGGENLEISFRIWMCGGQLEIIPCSRVGHVFRQRRPYGSPTGEDTLVHNSLRVAHVWMDDYKEYFLKQRSDVKSLNYGDVSSRLQLRKELKCRDFEWYLDHVYPELALPSDDQDRLKKKWAALEPGKYQPWHSRKRNYVDQYQLRLANSTLCLQSAKDAKSKGAGLALRPCLRVKVQMWFETDKNELVLDKLLCLQVGKPGPILYKCHEMGGDQEWWHKGETNTPVYNVAAGTCLGAKRKEVNAAVTMKLCSEENLITWDVVR